MKIRGIIWVVAIVLSACLTGCMQNVDYGKTTMEGPVTDVAFQETISFSDVICYEEPEHSTYAYDCLSEAQKIWYQDINTVLAGRSDEPAVLSPEGFEMGLGEEDIALVFQSVLLDHPEYFFVEGYDYTIYTSIGEITGIELKGTYGLSVQMCLERKALIDEAVVQIVDRLPENADDYEKIKFVYETIIYHTQYSLDASDNQNIYSVFVGQESVCQGYAKATQYLLNRLGVECTTVFGSVNTNEGHAWNLVKADGKYYYLDTTWGDASYLAERPEQVKWTLPDINYDYLCITTAQLQKTHTIDHPFVLPVCDAWENNYYVREGRLFTSYDEEKLDKVFADTRQNGNLYVTLKCSEEAVYSTMQQELIQNQKIFQYLNESCETIAYIENEQQLSLTFWMTN